MESLQKYLKKAFLWVLDLVLTFVGVSLLEYVFKLIENPSLEVGSIKGIVGIVAIIGATALTVYLLINRMKKPKTDVATSIIGSRDPRLKHVEARLFYSSDVNWEKKQIDPKKNNPRHKLILVKDLKKAYHVGTYAWDLILKNKIEWFSEDDQDLEEWCKKRGYTLIPDDASEDKLLEPYYLFEIVDKKTEYMRGESVYFRTHYRGRLIKGFFDNEMTPLSGERLPDGRSSYWKWSPETMDNPYGEGKLDGFFDHQETWNWIIPYDAPTGQYRVIMGVLNHHDVNNRPRIAHKEDIITLVKRLDSLIPQSENESELNQTKTELLQALYFFLKHWKTYETLIKKINLKPPQNEQIKWCSDQIKSAIINARILNNVRVNVVIPKIEAVSDEMAMFGMDVLERFPTNMEGKWINNDPNTIVGLLLRGNKICDELKKVIADMEKAFR